MFAPMEPRPLARGLAAAALALPLWACGSIELRRDTLTSGRFESSGVALTVLSRDLPKPAVDIARENARDARLPNMQVEEVRVRPNLGGFDWLLDILGLRFARIRGTWGTAP